MQKILSFLLIFCFWSVPIWAKAPRVGDLAPEFNLVSMDGEKINLSSLRGKVILIGMFHICIPCMNQALEFDKVRSVLSSEKLVIFGINTAGDSRDAVANYLRGFPSPIHFPYLLDPNQSVHKLYIQRDMPTVLIIGPNGKLLARSPSVGADQLISYINKLL